MEPGQVRDTGDSSLDVASFPRDNLLCDIFKIYYEAALQGFSCKRKSERCAFWTRRFVNTQVDGHGNQQLFVPHHLISPSLPTVK